MRSPIACSHSGLWIASDNFSFKAWLSPVFTMQDGATRYFAPVFSVRITVFPNMQASSVTREQDSSRDGTRMASMLSYRDNNSFLSLISP